MGGVVNGPMHSLNLHTWSLGKILGFLNLPTWLKPHNKWPCGLGQLGLGMVTFFELPHMVDATEHLMICQH